jgi:spermidine synthase
MASIEVSEEDGVRYLHFGSRWIQGAMRIARTNALELEYTRDMLLPLLLRRGSRWPRTALLIGLGAASFTRFLARYRPHAVQTVIEIDPAVIGVARQYFKLPEESSRLRILIDDGADYMIATDRNFDLILVDGFDAKGRAGSLDTLPFYCNCLARLSETGVLATNHLSGSHGVRGSVERVRTAFNGRALALPACESGNVIALAAGGAPIDATFADLQQAARKLRSETRLDLGRTVTRLAARIGGERFVL